MDMRHEYILTTVAERLNMTLHDAKEFMLDDNQVSQLRINVWVATIIT